MSDRDRSEWDTKYRKVINRLWCEHIRKTATEALEKRRELYDVWKPEYFPEKFELHWSEDDLKELNILTTIVPEMLEGCELLKLKRTESFFDTLHAYQTDKENPGNTSDFQPHLDAELNAVLQVLDEQQIKDMYFLDDVFRRDEGSPSIRLCEHATLYHEAQVARLRAVSHESPDTKVDDWDTELEKEELEHLRRKADQKGGFLSDIYRPGTFLFSLRPILVTPNIWVTLGFFGVFFLALSAVSSIGALIFGDSVGFSWTMNAWISLMLSCTTAFESAYNHARIKNIAHLKFASCCAAMSAAPFLLIWLI